MDSGCSYLLTVCDFPYVPGPVLGPRDTSMNKADIPVVMVVCFLPPSLFSFILTITERLLHGMHWRGCWECTEITVHLLRDQQVSDNTFTFCD